MSLRCSLLGHSYGDAEIEREREEQGSEVVVTVREFEECERCGDRRVVTENKEVTAIETPAPSGESAEGDAAAGASNVDGANGSSSAGPDASTGPDATPDPDSPSGPDAGVGRTGGGHDAEIITDSPSSGDPSAPDSDGSPSSDAGAAADASGGDGADATADPEGADADVDAGPSAAEDDGVILDDDGGADSGDDARTAGEWPEADTTHPAETDESGATEWPDVGREDEGYDAEPDDGERTDVEFGGGLTPESAGPADGEDEEVEFVNAEGDTLQARDAGGSGPELSSGISAGAEAPSLSGPADDPDLDAEFVCPECDYRASVSGSSLRAGDICPECARGYLAQE
ncbi:MULTISPECIES: oxidoreductase [Halorussus]|uniref:DUF7093 family protein n=1 Tax=Halorussus TaxID=1070314 RepID=UPI000E20EF73|nr:MULTISPECIES: oxidoreductase [Halorussus]NHN57494.1 oxidoreductase [Halorussus sp. JP-T4]